MKISRPILALLSAVTTALATGEPASIPANNWCTDLNNIFGNFNNQVRSMIVEKGFKCGFFVNNQCPASGIKYEFGSKDLALAVGELPEWLDMRIKSVYCSEA
ncbi:hypothetical protein BDU57DRAFT_541676 [Ampelomyces quisqualis]|uniref:Beta/gamma crystallin 'Greek key' domain-containing protein n=1 Tax=Ampelomyces quisqualis TaxID=50730 RepID=A0A6A5QBK2_AMPQU|nr:hypothetical protein BDU57DRAFT_541676 [Ampelomyces quisqualis]